MHLSLYDIIIVFFFFFFEKSLSFSLECYLTTGKECEKASYRS